MQTTKRLAALAFALMTLVALVGCSSIDTAATKPESYRVVKLDAAHLWPTTFRDTDKMFWYDDLVPWGPKKVNDRDRTISRTYLHEDEARWLRRNKVVPSIPAGLLLEDVLEKRHPNITRLSRVRVLNGRHGTQLIRPETKKIFWPEFTAQNLDLHASQTAPASLGTEWDDGLWNLRFVGTVPAAGKPVDLHGITFVARWVWAPNMGDSDGDGILNFEDNHSDLGYYGGDDDDFNIPGWLCPTRFC
jgi:hypothetical protein